MPAILHLIWNYKTHTPRWSCRSPVIHDNHTWMQSFMIMFPDDHNDIRLTASGLKSHQVCMHVPYGNNKRRKAPSWLVHIQASLNLGRILLTIAGSLAGIVRIRRTSALHLHPRQWRHAHMQAGLWWAPWRKRQPSRIGRQLTPSQRPSLWTARPQQHHRGDRDISQLAITPRTSIQNGLHAGNACSPIRNHAASHAVSYWSFCFPILPFPAWTCIHWTVAATIPIRSRNHGNRRILGIWIQSNHANNAYTHPVKLREIASWPVPRIQPWMVRNGSCTSCFIIPSHMHGKYLRLTQHDNTILSRLAACRICSHSHPCSQRIIHDCIQALPIDTG